jgi:hypothetical protein
MSHVSPLNNRLCRCNSNAGETKFHPCKLTRRIGQYIGMIAGSMSDGECANAATMLRRLVESECVPDLTMIFENFDGRLEQKKYSDENAKIIFERGVERGRSEEARNRQQAEPTEHRDADGRPLYHPMAVYCQQHRVRLASKHHEFIDKMASITVYREPSDAQGKYLLSLFIQLGNGRLGR